MSTLNNCDGVSEKSTEIADEDDDGSIELIEPPEDDDIQDDHLENSHYVVEKPSLERIEKPASEPCVGDQSPRQKVPSKASQKGPRPASRRPKRSGSLRLSRTRGPSISEWGNASTPSSISLKDLMGSERKATHVGLVEQSPRRRAVKAETKRVNIRKMKGAKKERRKDVSDSLSHFLHQNELEQVSDNEEEDDSLISEEEGGIGGGGGDDIIEKQHDDEIIKSDHEKSDGEGEKSIKSQKGQTPRRFRVRRPASKDEGGGGNSDHSRKRMSRVRRVARGDGGDGDDKSISSTGTGGGRRDRSRRNRRTMAEKRKVRPVGDSHSLDGSELQRRPHHGDTASLDGNTTNRRGRRHADDTDDRSVGSRRSRRRRLKSDARPTRRKSNSAKENGKRCLSGWKSPVVKGSASDGSEEEEDGSDGLAKPSSIPRKISVQPVSKPCGDLDDESDASSQFSNLDQPPLIQFDPNQNNYVTYVNQSKGNTTSETIRHSDGTEYEFHITTELEGLPTFEVLPSELHDSVRSDLSDCPVPPPMSSASLGPGISEGNKEGVTSDIDVGKEQSASNLKSTEQVADGKESFKVSPRKIKRNNSGGAMGFLQRRMRGKTAAAASPAAAAAASPATGTENGDLNKSHTFFGRFKRNERDDSDEDEDGVGFFKKREAKTHQALDDGDSDND